MTKKHTVDVQIEGGFGFYQFSLLTRRAVAWKRRNVCAEPWNGDSTTFCSDDTRYAQEIAQAMTDAGLTVQG